MFIQKLGLKNFKCFKKVDVEFSKITLLTGENSSGKSSFIYGLLSPFQSINWTEGFPLFISFNGKHVSMGGYEDVSFDHDLDKEIGIDLCLQFRDKYNDETLFLNTCWCLDTLTKSPQLSNLKINLEDREIKVSRSKKNLYNVDHSLWNRSQETQQTYDVDLEAIDDSFLEGITNDRLYNDFELGNYFNFISSFRFQPDRTYYQSLARGGVDRFGNGYIDQILKWNDTQSKKLAQLIFSLKTLGIIYDVKAQKIQGGRFEIKIKVKNWSKWESLADVGFGISQFMPIIVADLQLRNNSVLIVSQPEIHLHPSVQANLGDYFVKQAIENSKQYILETHSEYLLNRIRLLIVKGEVEPEDVAVYYFENSTEEGAITRRIKFAKDGQILNAPQGFFETYMIDTMDIALNA